MLLEQQEGCDLRSRRSDRGAVARAFAHEGADLFLAGRTRARVESVAEEISAAGGVAEAAEVDALDEDAIEKHMDDVVARGAEDRRLVQRRWHGRRPGDPAGRHVR